MHFSLEPHVGANPLTFGLKRKRVREILYKIEFHTLKKEPENDFYTEAGLILGYDEIDELEFIEIFPPSTAIFKDVMFFENSLTFVMERMNQLGFSANLCDGMFDFEKAGIVLYCPNEHIESVSIYRAGYYDN